MFSLGTHSLVCRTLAPRAVGMVALALCSLGTLAASRCEAAATYTWNPIFSDWQFASHWTPPRTSPAADDILQFDRSATVTNVPTQTIGRLVVSNYSSLTLEAAAAGRELTVATTTGTGLDVPSGNTLTTGSPGLKLTVGPGVTASIGGTLAVGAAFTNHGTTTVNGTFKLNSGGSLAGNGPTYGGASILNYRTTGTFGRGAEWSATSGAGYPANVGISNNTTLDLGANGGAAITRAMSGNLTIDPGSKLGMNQSGHVMTGNLKVSGDVTVSGTLELGMGSLTSETGSIEVGGNWTLSPGGAFLLGPSSHYCARVAFNGSGTQAISATGVLGFPSIFINKTSGIVQLACDVLVHAEVADGLSMEHGGLDLNGHQLSSSSSGDWNTVVNNGTHSILSSSGSGTVFFDWGSLTTTGNGSLVFGEGVTVSCYTGMSLDAPVTFNGVLEGRNGGLVSGTTTPPITYGSNSVLHYVVAGTKGAGMEWSQATGSSAPMNVEITGSGTFSLNSWSWQTGVTPHGVRGYLTVGPGCTLLQNSDLPLSVQGNVTVAGAMGFTAAGNLEVGGNWTRIGTFTPASHLVTFKGSALQSITGATTFDGLTVDGAGVWLNADITVNQVLTFTSGNLTTGAKKVAVGGLGSINHTSGHVVGNLQLPVPVGLGVSKTFVIGDASRYTPVGVAFDSVTTAGNLTASTTGGDHPQLGSSTIDPGLSVNRFWTLTDGGVVFKHFDATFNFWPGDLDPGVVPSDFIVGRYDGAWSYPTVGTKNGSSTQATGLTAFGDFALGEASPQPVCFAAPLVCEAGDNPLSVAIGDLNGDGKLDLVVVPEFYDSVFVVLGKGDGTFEEKRGFGTRAFPADVAIGDFNGDGKPDLVVASKGSAAVSVLLGNGDGTFGAKMDYGTGSTSESVAIGDLNYPPDGKLDVVTVGHDSVWVLLGNGDGTFEEKRGSGTGGSPHDVAIGDLNGDGKPDLTTANDPGVWVLLGNGDGTFEDERGFGAGSRAWHLAIGDLNYPPDGKLDVVIDNLGPDCVSVLLGKGDGTFEEKRNFGTGSFPNSVAIGDLNGDGKPDLAVVNHGANTVSVLLGNGAGGFAAKTDFGTGNSPTSMAIGDLNGDGKPDLAVAYLDHAPGTVSVLLNCTPFPVAVDPTPPAPPRIFQFLAPRPNPSRGPSEIQFLLPAACTVDVALFDLAGRRVRSLASGGLSMPGEHTIRWDGRDASGAPAHSGIYFVQVRAGRDVGVRRLVVLH